MFLLSALTVLLFGAAIASAQSTVANPLTLAKGSTSLPVGITAYGLSNVLTSNGPYQVSTSEIIGYAKVNSMQAFNATPGINNSKYGASIQLNAVLNITSNFTSNYYLLQDMVVLNTSAHTFYYADYIQNITNPNANITNFTLVGIGNVSYAFSPLSRTKIGFYNYSVNITGVAPYNGSTSYTYPFYFAPFMLVNYSYGSWPSVQIGYLQQNGTPSYYDDVTFFPQNSSAANWSPPSAAKFLVSPYGRLQSSVKAPHNVDYYDAELVFGGAPNETSTNFNNMSSTLWMGYLNNNNVLVPFPYVATFGADSTEGATNLSVTQGNGYALVKTGRLNYNSTVSISGIPNNVTAIPVNGTYTAQTNVTTPQSLPLPTPAAQAHAKRGLLGLTTVYYVAIAIAAAVILILAISLARRKK